MKGLLALIIVLLCSLPLAAQNRQALCRKATSARSRMLVVKKQGIRDSALVSVAGHIVPIASVKKPEAISLPMQWVVDARNVKTNAAQRISTDKEGGYRFWLEKGTYQFTVSGVGFPTTTFKPIAVSAGNSWQVNFSMGEGVVWAIE